MLRERELRVRVRGGECSREAPEAQVEESESLLAARARAFAVADGGVPGPELVVDQSLELQARRLLLRACVGVTSQSLFVKDSLSLCKDTLSL